MNNTETLSASRINFLFNCDYNYYLRYIELLPIEEGITKYIDIGNYIHKIIELFYDNLNLNLIKKITKIEQYIKYINLSIEILRKKLKNDFGKELEKYEDLIISNLLGFKTYEIDRFTYYLSKYKVIKENFKPKYLELKLKSDKYHGIIDCIFEYDDEIIIVDWKTSNQTIENIEYVRQLRIYQHLYEYNFNKNITYLENAMSRTKKIIRFDRFVNNNRYLSKMRTKYYKILDSILKEEFKYNGKYCYSCGYFDICGGNTK